MKSYVIFFTALLTSVSAALSIKAQDSDTITNKPLKNTVRFNLSAPLIFGDRYLVFGYERMVSDNRSFSFNAGTFGLPDFVNTDSLTVGHERKDRGFHISADYRLYLPGENRHRAPRGVYIGPYYSFNHLTRENSWAFNTGSYSGNTNTSLKVNIHSIGFQLGYQFVFGKRFAVDMVAVGPGIAHYSFKTNIDADLTPENKSKLLQAIAQRIREKIPGAGSFLSDERYKKDSGVATWYIGYRYIVHIGYRF